MPETMKSPQAMIAPLEHQGGLPEDDPFCEFEGEKEEMSLSCSFSVPFLLKKLDEAEAFQKKCETHIIS